MVAVQVDKFVAQPNGPRFFGSGAGVGAKAGWIILRGNEGFRVDWTVVHSPNFSS